MARPLRRVIINLACKLGISYREIETWDMETIREHIWMLIEMNKSPKEREEPSAPMSEKELEARLRVHLGTQPEN